MGALLKALYVVAHAHTIGRVQAAYKVATFPILTNRAGDPKFWAACGRLAWNGFWRWSPNALDTLVRTREQVARVAEVEARELMRRNRA